MSISEGLKILDISGMSQLFKVRLRDREIFLSYLSTTFGPSKERYELFIKDYDRRRAYLINYEKVNRDNDYKLLLDHRWDEYCNITVKFFNKEDFLFNKLASSSIYFNGEDHG